MTIGQINPQKEFVEELTRMLKMKIDQIKLPKEFVEELIREGPLFSIKAWYEGESKELEKWLGFGLYNTLFISRYNVVTFHYDSGEAGEFHEVLKEKLTEDFFNNLCENFFELIESPANTNEDIYRLLVKCFPALMIFDEISKYPEITSDDIIRRLERVRKNTESFSYDLIKKVNLINEPKNYIYFRGNLYFNKIKWL